MRLANATTLLHMHFYSIQHQRLLRSQRKDEMPPRILLHTLVCASKQSRNNQRKQ